ncbi:unnamed protein product [Caenorhabditis brenneri]
MSEASFYWFFGYGYKEVLPIASGCVRFAALILIRAKDSLPREGGVYITADAFGDSSYVMDHSPRRILLYDRLIALIVLQLLYLTLKLNIVLN